MLFIVIAGNGFARVSSNNWKMKFGLNWPLISSLQTINLLILFLTGFPLFRQLFPTSLFTYCLSWSELSVTMTTLFCWRMLPVIAERGKEREALISDISALDLILLVVLIVFDKINTHKQIVMCWCMFVSVICRALESFVKIWSFNTFMWSFINSTASSKETANIVLVIQFFSEKNTSPLGRQCPRRTLFLKSHLDIFFSEQN